MLNIGYKVMQRRKEQNLSQSDLDNAVEASRDIIGKYERNDNLPSIEKALKLAKVFDVSVDYLLGEGEYASYDKNTIRRLEDMEKLPNEERQRIFHYMDLIIRDY